MKVNEVLQLATEILMEQSKSIFHDQQITSSKTSYEVLK